MYNKKKLAMKILKIMFQTQGTVNKVLNKQLNI